MTWDINPEKLRLMNACKHDGAWMQIDDGYARTAPYFKCCHCGFTAWNIPDSWFPQIVEEENLTP